MNELQAIGLVFGLTFGGLLLVLLAGDSVFKFNNKTLAQTIKDWFRLVTKRREE